MSFVKVKTLAGLAMLVLASVGLQAPAQAAMAGAAGNAGRIAAEPITERSIATKTHGKRFRGAHRHRGYGWHRHGRRVHRRHIHRHRAHRGIWIKHPHRWHRRHYRRHGGVVIYF